VSDIQALAPITRAVIMVILLIALG
jgi:hypothetical protein